MDIHPTGEFANQAKVYDYDGFRREMYRTTVLGEVPV